jgi:hypothetical protein
MSRLLLSAAVLVVFTATSLPSEALAQEGALHPVAPQPPQSPTSNNSVISAPAQNCVLPLFSAAGFRSMTLRGNEARLSEKDRIDVKEINITVFSGDAATKVTTSVLSTEASYFPSQNLAQGPGDVHIIHYVDGTDASGDDWTYDFKREKVSIRHNVRVEFTQALNDPLK